jgi:hypothetical protein
LEGEGLEDDEDEEAAAERTAKYSRRQLGTNADRYVEPEPELDSDGVSSIAYSCAQLIFAHMYTGEKIVEPEVNLSPFLERQRLSDLSTPSLYDRGKIEDGDEVDHSLAHLSSRNGVSAPASRKGQVQYIEWDDGLDQLSRQKAATEAEKGVLMIYVRVRHLQLKLTKLFYLYRIEISLPRQAGKHSQSA